MSETLSNISQNAELLILIAQSDILSRLELRKMLEAWQYRVIEAENGDEVIELTKEFRPRLIFVDMLLPVLDGLTATRRIREFSSIHTAIITFLSVYKDWEMRDVAISAGCDDCLVKPFSEISLKTTIDKYTGNNLPKDTIY